MMVSCGVSSWIPRAELQEREQTVEEAWLGSWMMDFVEDSLVDDEGDFV